MQKRPLLFKFCRGFMSTWLLFLCHSHNRITQLMLISEGFLALEVSPLKKCPYRGFIQVLDEGRPLYCTAKHRVHTQAVFVCVCDVTCTDIKATYLLYCTCAHVHVHVHVHVQPYKVSSILALILQRGGTLLNYEFLISVYL